MKLGLICDCLCHTEDPSGTDMEPWGYRFNIFDKNMIDAKFKCPECLHIVSVSMIVDSKKREKCCGEVMCQCRL